MSAASQLAIIKIDKLTERRKQRMKRRNIFFTGPSVAELVEDEIGAPKENEVQVRLVASTISSGTERANLIGDPNVAMGAQNKVVWPRVLGYSSSGVIEAVGAAVTDLKPGDRVAMAWTTHCERVNINHTDMFERANVYQISDQISFQNAALFSACLALFSRSSLHLRRAFIRSKSDALRAFLGSSRQ